MADAYDTLKIEREAHLTWLIPNRPDALNAMTWVLVHEMRALSRGLTADRPR